MFFLQSKRRFERDCKEADRAQQYFEKMDADINVTKADVEKVSWRVETDCKHERDRFIPNLPGRINPLRLNASLESVCRLIKAREISVETFIHIKTLNRYSQVSFGGFFFFFSQ